MVKKCDINVDAEGMEECELGLQEKRRIKDEYKSI